MTSKLLFFGVAVLAFTGCYAHSHVYREPVERHSQEHEELMRSITSRKNYDFVSRANPSDRLRMTVAVTQQNTHKLEELLLKVSTPSSPDYGKFVLSAEEANAIVAPSKKSVELVTGWLQSHGIDKENLQLSSHGDFISFSTNVSQAEEIIGAKYWTWRHKHSGTVIHRAVGLEHPRSQGEYYTVPAHVAEHIDFLAPTVTFPAFPEVKRVAAKPQVTPSFLRNLYNITMSGKGADSKNKQGIASFIKQYYAASDLKAFQNKYKMASNLPVDVPENQPHSPIGTEASLDVQWISVSGMNVSFEHWSTPGVQPGNEANEPFVAWLEKLSKTDTDVRVFSISYGDEEHGVTESYALRAGVEFQKAGARGISLLAASGDSGAGCAIGAFVPTFPASCPWITGVGGTTGGKAGSSPTGEYVADLSGGGFSNYFAAPSYQEDAIKAYKSKPGLPQQRMWNQTGSGFPDVAAQAIGYDSCTENFFFPISGTSCACPSVSGMIATLNQWRMDNGKAVLGFLNPLLYQIGASNNNNAFNDITDGTNTYCDQDSGFPAAKGWDAVTGWGTINFGKMMDELSDM